MEITEQNKANQHVIDSSTAIDVTTTDVLIHCSPDKDVEKKVLHSFVGHITKLFKKFSKEDGSLRVPDNQEIINEGRDEEERQQIEEFCKDIDEQNKLDEELQKFKAADQNNTAQEWLRLKVKDELDGFTPEEKEAILIFVDEQQGADIQEQAEALEKVLENAAIADSINNKEEAEDE